VVIYFSLEQEVEELGKAEQAEGSLSTSLEPKLMRSVLENDKQTVEKGELVEEAINRNITSFSPDMNYEQLVSNYRMAQKILGPKLIRFLTGYDDRYVQKNLRIPEFRKHLKEQMQQNIQKLKDDNILDRTGSITDTGIELASLILYMREIENIMPKGNMGQKITKKKAHYGERSSIDPFRREDRYKDLSIRSSIRVAVKRGHQQLVPADLRKYSRVKKSKVNVVYALDSSASMKGDKIGVAKKAGVALAFRALSQNDKVGLIVFGKEVTEAVEPTQDFGLLLNKFTRVRASKQTDFVKMVRRATELFAAENVTKHLLILTDAMPTAGESPEKQTIRAIGAARNENITVSIIGIGLDKEGAQFARKCVEVGGGRLYMVRDLNRLDRIVLQDYESLT
jgi:Mg-chelatase subunit ChlD